MTKPNWIFSIDDARAAISADPEGRLAAYPIRHGSMRVGLYAPKGEDPQKPHVQDEIYIIASGSGSFVKGDERIAFKPQDVLFVEAGVEHRFEDFTEDFSTWVVFWGPDGGEGGAS